MALRQSASLLLVSLALGCVTATQTTTKTESPALAAALAIQKVSATPKELRLDQGEVTTLALELTQPASVRVEIDDEVGTLVRPIDLGPQRAGPVSATWDGTNSAGQKVPSGIYLYRVTATGSDGAPVTAEPAVPGGNEVLAQEFTLDPETGTMRFLLPQPSRIRLRVGLRGYPLLRTIYDWTPMLAGEHEVTWDGHDATGKIELRKQSNLDVNLSAFAIPGNSIVVTGNGPLGRGPAGVPAGMPAQSYRHALHPTQLCHEPRLHLEIIDSRNKLPKVTGTVPVRVTLDDADAVQLVNTRFELMFFIDTVFLSETEEGSNPFTYSLDTRALAPGRHLLTVNVLGYDDHFGTATIEFERSPGPTSHGE